MIVNFTERLSVIWYQKAKNLNNSINDPQIKLLQTNYQLLHNHQF